MELVSNFFKMEIDIKENILAENLKAKEFIIGIMEQYIEASLKMGLDMGVDNGNSRAKSTKGTTLMISDGERVNIIGTKLIFIKDHFLMI
jgi:hypothetical protein